MEKRKHFRNIALGMLVIAAGNLIDRFVMPINDFLHGICFGIGFGLMALSVYRMKHNTSC